MVIVLALIGVGPWAAPAAATHVLCGDTIVADTVLDSDLIDCPANGIVVGADGVTLDLAGHTVDGTGRGHGISHDGGTSSRSVTVEDGEISGFGAGIFQGEARDGRMTTRHVDLVANGIGVDCFFSKSCEIENSTVRQSTGPAVGVSYGGAVRVQRTTLVENGSGLSFGEGVHGSIKGNTIARNRGIGLKTHDSGELSIADNLIADNAGDGVSFFITSHVSFTHNRVLRNQVGVNVRSEVGYAIAANTIARNRANGLQVGTDTAVRCAATRSVTTRGSGAVFGGCSTVRGNLFLHNAGDGLALTFGEDLCGGTSTVAGDVSWRNAGDGIAVRGNGSPVLVERNWAHGNGDDGIDIATPIFGASELTFSPDNPAMRSWPRARSSLRAPTAATFAGSRTSRTRASRNSGGHRTGAESSS